MFRPPTRRTARNRDAMSAPSSNHLSCQPGLISDAASYDGPGHPMRRALTCANHGAAEPSESQCTCSHGEGCMLRAPGGGCTLASLIHAEYDDDPTSRSLRPEPGRDLGADSRGGARVCPRDDGERDRPGLAALLPAAAPSRLLGSSTVLVDGPRRGSRSSSREYSASWER